ncbi:23S rRNA (adenine(1618)-N(6))-methyltransferase RlmF [Aurantibacter sp.]|uniref:23S rRNA (adenine(1618)-N(6))-methyltransferase RlmF n=1 Tax=Aurantibacter sp. TaxID=2807103 RepID=UPI0032660CB1
MSSEKNKPVKSRLHPRNRNREQYNLEALVATTPELKHYLKPNKKGIASVDFANPIAVKQLNKAILNHYYGIKNWEFPDENLCPPIPGRADYIHYLADILSESNFGKLPTGDKISCYDIGVGANCIYPIIGVTEYGWNFIGSDIESKSIAIAEQIVETNPSLKNKISLRLQSNYRAIFKGAIDKQEQIDISICNPPFHSSIEEALKGTRRKIKNLSGRKVKNPELNFAGISNELIYEGGEQQFIRNMVYESKHFAKNIFWFSTLVSKESNLRGIYKSLKKVSTNEVKTIAMGTSNKSSRIVAWTFFSNEEQKEWRATRWK